MVNKFGYGFCVDGVYKYGYKYKSTAYAKLHKHKPYIRFTVFKIDAIGFHIIQEWQKI